MEKTNKDKPGILVYVIAFAFVAVVFTVNLRRVPVLSASQLIKLIQNSELDPIAEDYVAGNDGTLTITSENESITYSNLRDVHLGKDKITGILDVTTLDLVNRKDDYREKVSFAVSSVSEQWNTDLIRLLERANINYFGDSGPSFLERYGFFLFVVILFLVIVFSAVRRSPRTAPSSKTSNDHDKNVAGETPFDTFVKTKSHRGWIVLPDTNTDSYLLFLKFGMHNEYKAFAASADPGIIKPDQLGMPVKVTAEVGDKNKRHEMGDSVKLKILKVEYCGFTV